MAAFLQAVEPQQPTKELTTPPAARRMPQLLASAMYSAPSGAATTAAAFQNLAVAAGPLTMALPVVAPTIVTTAPLLTFTLRTLLVVPLLSITYSVPLPSKVRPAGPARLAVVPTPSVQALTPLPARVVTVQSPEVAGGGKGLGGGGGRHASSVTLPLAPLAPGVAVTAPVPTLPTSSATPGAV